MPLKSGFSDGLRGGQRILAEKLLYLRLESTKLLTLATPAKQASLMAKN
jgi:hypothetical protein